MAPFTHTTCGRKLWRERRSALTCADPTVIASSRLDQILIRPIPASSSNLVHTYAHARHRRAEAEGQAWKREGTEDEDIHEPYPLSRSIGAPLSKLRQLEHLQPYDPTRSRRRQNVRPIDSTPALPLSSLDAMPTNTHDIPSIAVTGSTEYLHLFTPNDDQHKIPLDDLVLRPLLSSQTARAHPPSPAFSLSQNPSSGQQETPSRPPPQKPPDEHDRISSLGLISPSASGHRRKGSNATFTSSISGSETETDHTGESSNIALSPLLTARSDASTLASPTHTHVDSASDSGSRPGSRSSFVEKFHCLRPTSRSPEGSDSIDTDASNALPPAPKPEKKGKGKKKREVERLAAIELEQSANKDPAPFAFKPFQLASHLDPKNIEALEDLGGVDGLLRGLGTHQTLGLGAANLAAKAGPPDHASQPVQGTRKSRDIEEGSEEQVPSITITKPSGEIKGLQSTASLSDAAQSASGSTPEAYGMFGNAKKQELTAFDVAGAEDKVLILLSVAAIVSLALGCFQDFGTPRASDDSPVDWVEGVAIIVAIVIVVSQKERQFKTLKEKEERAVKVIRGGVEMLVDVHEVVVGDVALLEPGEIVPCDGIFLSGYNVWCDKVGATGESDAIKKLSYEECIRIHDERLLEDSPAASDVEQAGHEGADGDVKREEGAPVGDVFARAHGPLHYHGSKVLDGVGSYVVIAVGTKSFNGRIMMALWTDAGDTPLQLNDLAEVIAKVGALAGLLLFMALMIRFFVQLGTGESVRTTNEEGIAFVQILIIAVMLVVVALPEGLPLAVTLALAFATKRMTQEKLLMRILGSCETMANASVICTDKTGTLTQNEMTIVAGSVGVHSKFVRQCEDNKARSNVDDLNTSDDCKRVQDFSLDQVQLNKVLSPALKTLFNDTIAVNSTAFEDSDCVVHFWRVGDQTGARAVHARPGISIERVLAHPVLGRGGKAGGACAARELVVGLEQARGPSRGGPLPAAAQSAQPAAALLGRVAVEASAILRALVGRWPLPQSVVGALELRGPLAAADFWLDAHGEHNGRAQQRLGGRGGLRGRLDGAQGKIRIPYLKAQTGSSVYAIQSVLSGGRSLTPSPTLNENLTQIIKIVYSIVAVCHNNLPPASAQRGNDILRELSDYTNKLSEVQAMRDTPTMQPRTGLTPRGGIFDVELGSVFSVIPIPVPISMPMLISPSVFSSSIWKPRSLSAYR
ncbi:Ca-transporting ATPase [Heterobasidion irregulare TC 32-1]|uniref:Ca-transporting ATPase n=1 Tax=Heterobasidion irregulare (strain TC 32-1) TaxID=747525 RepID=W4JVT1_HETIT|nr:Ca-transporting ATPase [Heterobasidion irregulare TC 32-1]ETW77652.1 Ca-transporting ATPase [Heterobasidion irregulare TC 32-1]